MYKGSRTNGTLKENFDFNGDFYTGMVGLFNAYGFDFAYAYSTVSKDQAALQGIGNDCGSFTATPIYGPFLFMSFAGMELNKFSVGYDLSKVGVNGLRLDADYWYGEQHNGSNVRCRRFGWSSSWHKDRCRGMGYTSYLQSPCGQRLKAICYL